MIRLFCASFPVMLSVGIVTALYYYFNTRVKRHQNKWHINNTQEALIDSIINDRCAICLDDIRGYKRIVRLECKHAFHSDCIDGILTGPCAQKLCPFCRRVIHFSSLLKIHQS